MNRANLVPICTSKSHPTPELVETMNDTTFHEHESVLARDPRGYVPDTAHGHRPRADAPARAGSAAGRFFARNVSGVWRRIARAGARRRTIAQLSRLDDHMLADIGISRARIPLVAQELIDAPCGEAPQPDPRRDVHVAPSPPEYHGKAANDEKTPPLAA